MSWIAWAAILYGVVGLIVFRPIAGHIAYSEAVAHRREGKPNGDDWAGGFLGGLICSVVWPVTLTWLIMSDNRFKIGSERAALERSRSGTR